MARMVWEIFALAVVHWCDIRCDAPFVGNKAIQLFQVNILPSPLRPHFVAPNRGQFIAQINPASLRSSKFQWLFCARL